MALLLACSLGVQAGNRNPAPPDWQFTEVTAAAGASSAFFFEFGYTETRDMMPGGVAAGDINNDGLIDLIVLQGDYWPLKVFRNRGDGRFESVASEHGLSLTGNVAAGALLVDLSGNGWLDLVLTGIRGFGTRLYLNDQGQFSEATLAWGLSGSIIDAYSAAAADIDGDGWLDLAVSHWDNRSGIADTAGHLWHNQGTHLVDISELAGLGVLQQPDYSFTPMLVDMDGDHRPDLLMASDFLTTRAFVNLGNLQFQQWDPAQFDDENGMGADVGDFDNDGDLDWFVSSIYDPSGQPSGGQGYTGNRLYRNDGDGVFTDVSETAGVRVGYWGWGACFADFDNDGWLDIFHVNGLPFGNHPVFRYDPARFFRNRGDGSFEEIAADLGIADTGQGRGIACFDHDRDGDIDIYIVNNEGLARLYRNDLNNGNHGLSVALRQAGPNSHAVGAELRLHRDGQTQLQHLIAGRGFQASSPIEAHFGLGQSAYADALDIRWPDGRTTRIAFPQAQPLLVVDDPDQIFRVGFAGPELQ